MRQSTNSSHALYAEDGEWRLAVFGGGLRYVNANKTGTKGPPLSGWAVAQPGPGLAPAPRLVAGGLDAPDELHSRDTVEQNYVAIYYSDDGGRSYSLSDTIFPASLRGDYTEPQLAETASGSVLLTMGRGASISERCGGYLCRASALSTSAGTSFGAPGVVPQLKSPGCQASILFHPPSRQLLFSNPDALQSRKNGTLQSSRDDGRTWTAVTTIDRGNFGYSCLSLLPSGWGRDDAAGPGPGVGEVNETHVAVLFEQYSWLAHGVRNYTRLKLAWLRV